MASFTCAPGSPVAVCRGRLPERAVRALVRRPHADLEEASDDLTPTPVAAAPAAEPPTAAAVALIAPPHVEAGFGRRELHRVGRAGAHVGVASIRDLQLDPRAGGHGGAEGVALDVEARHHDPMPQRGLAGQQQSRHGFAGLLV